MLAPPELKKIHPLGKSPVLEDNGLVLAESGAILEYLQETYDTAGQLKPADPQGKIDYRFWLHYAEGSLMPLLMMKLVFGSLGKPPVPFGFRTVGKLLGQGVQKSYLNKQIATHAQFIEQSLNGREWFAGDRFSMADIQMIFPVIALLARGGTDNLPNLARWKQRVEQRPSWQRAMTKGGPFSLPGA